MNLRNTFMAIMLFAFIGSSCSNNKQSNTSELHVITMDKTSSLSEVIQVQSASFMPSYNAEQQVLPLKVKKWGENYLYQTNDIYIVKTKLLLLDKAWNTLAEISPSSGAPGSVREISDFFIKNDSLHVYDFQSQKFVLFDHSLSYIGEKRTPYYFLQFAFADSMVYAYTGKTTQYADGTEHSYDLMKLDMNLDPTGYLRKFTKEKYEGMVFHTTRPLISTATEIFYSEWWNDTLFSISPNADPRFIFDYGNNALPASVNDLSHSEIYQNILKQEYERYSKGASPTSITENQILFSYGRGNRVQYGIHDIENRSSRIFSDYNYTLEERLLAPIYSEGDTFVSILYPYELTDYLHSGILNENQFDGAFLSRLYKENPDGTPVVIRFQLQLN